MENFKHSQEQKDIAINFLLLIAQLQMLLILTSHALSVLSLTCVCACTYTSAYLYAFLLYADVYAYIHVSYNISVTRNKRNKHSLILLHPYSNLPVYLNTVFFLLLYSCLCQDAKNSPGITIMPPFSSNTPFWLSHSSSHQRADIEIQSIERKQTKLISKYLKDWRL